MDDSALAGAELKVEGVDRRHEKVLLERKRHGRNKPPL
jgi:hypothetical protein